MLKIFPVLSAKQNSDDELELMPGNQDCLPQGNVEERI